jgi:protein-L-isoaspartate(D-aspartate) O-methyltransferase
MTSKTMARGKNDKAVAERKQALIAEIVRETAETAAMTGRDALSPRLLGALSKVRREAFVPEIEAPLAYVNAPLPIGSGQTISQPFIVAIMTELLDLQPDDVVLEIGTGSGYQAAILAELARKVYSVEVISELAEIGRRALAAGGYRNVEIRCGDGALGWTEHAPYDAIIVTAAAAQIPEALLTQLRPGGRMVIPVGKPHERQRLIMIQKDAAGDLSRRDIMGVAFVPLVTEGN